MSDMKLIMENWRRFEEKKGIEEAEISGFDPDKFPNPLPPEDQETFKIAGKDDQPSDGEHDADVSDDQVGAAPGGKPAKQLMPSQSAVYLSKAFGMSTIPKLSTGGQIDAVITEDDHILDGHHRWAATILRGGGGDNILGTVIALPIGQAIPILRALGDSFQNNRKGNPGGTDINIFTAQATSPDVLKTVIEENAGKNEFYNKEAWLAHLEALGGYGVLME